MNKAADILRKDIKEILDDPNQSDFDIQLAEDALISFAREYTIDPPAHLKNRILSKIQLLNKNATERRGLHLDILPLLEENSNWLDWNEVVRGIEPPEDFDGIYLHMLESNKERDLFIAWVKEYVAEEVHYDLLESFLILEGTCECHISDTNGNTRVVRLAEGDFITMGVGETHDVIITSLKPAKAILQWKKLQRG